MQIKVLGELCEGTGPRGHKWRGPMSKAAVVGCSLMLPTLLGIGAGAGIVVSIVNADVTDYDTNGVLEKDEVLALLVD